MGVLVACSGSDSELAELRKELEQTKAELDELQDRPTPETSSVTLGVEEKEYYRQACEDSLGVPPISWEGCPVAIELVSEAISGSSQSSKQKRLTHLMTWLACEKNNSSGSRIGKPNTDDLMSALWGGSLHEIKPTSISFFDAQSPSGGCRAEAPKIWEPKIGEPER